MLEIPTDRAIWAQGLDKSYGHGPVLRGLELSVRWGECLALFGPNGAGKSTLLRILAAQARPSAGTVVVAGCRLPRQAAAARGQTGVVAHANLLYDDLSGLENLVFYGRLYGLEHPRRRAQEVLELLKLQNLAGMRVRTLSHGQQKRLSIGRAILHKPRLLLLDEAEAGLDAESLQVLQELVAEWVAPGRAEPQRAVVMTTHNQGLGHAWATRALELRNGQLQPLLARETAGRGTAR